MELGAYDEIFSHLQLVKFLVHGKKKKKKKKKKTREGDGAQGPREGKEGKAGGAGRRRSRVGCVRHKPRTGLLYSVLGGYVHYGRLHTHHSDNRLRIS